jgi:hypothetical protein
MTDEWSRIAANSIDHHAMMAAEAWKSAAYSYERPSVMFRPKIYPDGNMWCALLGDDLQSGVSGFGDTPDKAMAAFDQAFWKGHTPAALRARAQGDA